MRKYLQGRRQVKGFGFRPKKDAHQAVGVIREALNDGCPYVLDADLQQYFDTIVHDKLMKLIAARISDRHILGWIKQWLRAPVVEEDQEGKRRSKPTERGTPQGSHLPTASQYLLTFV